jgi:hypothetical protein
MIEGFIASRDIGTSLLEVTAEMVLRRAPIRHTEKLDFILVDVDFLLLGDGEVMAVAFELEAFFLAAERVAGEVVDIF